MFDTLLSLTAVRSPAGLSAAAPGSFAEEPYLLPSFDRIGWYPLSADELSELRADITAGRIDVPINAGMFTVADHLSFLELHREAIEALRNRHAEAFDVERAGWAAAGEFDPRPEPEVHAPVRTVKLPAGAVLLEAPCTAVGWPVDVTPAAPVMTGDRLLTLEAMNLKTRLNAPGQEEILQVLGSGFGDQVQAGAPLVVAPRKPA